MAIGFDFGTANCSVAQVIGEQVKTIPLVGDELYIPSTLCAPTRESISEYLFRCLNISPLTDSGENLLRRAIRMNDEEGLVLRPDDVLFGNQALDFYLDDPKHVYYVKSPKSFLGTMGLRDMQLSFFEDLVCAMMGNIKQRAELALDKPITETVIGRPVNYHGRGGEESNKQAIEIMQRAAQRAGFKHVEFQFEPVAAGLDYEATLTSNKNVLVVDIGGGTSDCSLIQMGPEWIGKSQRNETLLSHTGAAVGGNDFDIAIAFKRFMSEFGLGSHQLSGLPQPIPQFWNCIAINDVEAQRKFYTMENLKQLMTLTKSAQHPEQLGRLIHVHRGTLGHSIVRAAEKTKIALGDQAHYSAEIDLLAEVLNIDVSYEQMETAIADTVDKIKRLVLDAIAHAQVTPDVVFITGGSARSPIVRQAIKDILPNIEIVSGNYFGSVTAGLARWANTCFK
ncbi:molecular chaperone [Vibrio sinensis]|uniref:Molecular chaperone n=1 Tax=Vibrio sinensis TaxID=2302434 RepID=A0A3A6QH39_9VIBR|nr:molecular chaperone [Vibrio sinensis]RJX65319.1 molecular chaperone [Vibrio sinensis]